MLACEAVESSERDTQRLAAWLASLPRPDSRTSSSEHAADARAAALGAVRLHAENDARRLSSCPLIPTHSGHPAAAQHRSTFEQECSPERASKCPILLASKRAQNLPAYDHVLASSIWRDRRGHGLGLGLEAPRSTNSS